MNALIQSAANGLALSLRDTGASMEPPTLTLHKMCYAYMVNDWVMIVTSFWTLVVTVASHVAQIVR